MKKLFTVLFVLSLAFMSINSSNVMAAGKNDTDLYTNGSELFNYIGSNKKPLYNNPSDPNVVGYVANQEVIVKQAWFLIKTSLGDKWVGYNGNETNLAYRLNSIDAQLKIDSKKPLYNSPSDPNVVGYVANQHVTVKQAWYLIKTSLGDKWIGYNL
ncbi:MULTISPECIES: hypothetical protein [Bacillus cereus group]|uniref:hypothetical protein n=1 Tax=Bacillus cereus group TaxID=86661 RepID=UPI000775640E|nr:MULTISPECIES: hypothetical protein [Bacillus cereus group]KXO02951.1 hypothetical protein AYK81_03630 [Bacillus thuringiensis]MCU5003630.1 hypothetical protein [Bacillus tropicus]TXR75947.1 hypothetical protein DN396_23695 [Bacillus sp. BF9-10]